MLSIEKNNVHYESINNNIQHNWIDVLTLNIRTRLHYIFETDFELTDVESP